MGFLNVPLIPWSKSDGCAVFLKNQISAGFDAGLSGF